MLSHGLILSKFTLAYQHSKPKRDLEDKALKFSEITAEFYKLQKMVLEWKKKFGGFITSTPTIQRAYDQLEKYHDRLVELSKEIDKSIGVTPIAPIKAENIKLLSIPPNENLIEDAWYDKVLPAAETLKAKKAFNRR